MNEVFKRMALLGDTWVLWLLIFASILSMAVIFERWLFFKKENLNFPYFIDKLSKLLEKKDFQGAYKHSLNFNNIETRIALTGLKHFSKGAISAEEAMISSLVREKEKMEKNLIILSTLGNNAPFIGLFGTVLGIIKAFNDLALTGSSGVSVVMNGIASALIATAFGIFVAIPSVIANNFFLSILKKKYSNSTSLIHFMKTYFKANDIVDENLMEIK